MAVAECHVTTEDFYFYHFLLESFIISPSGFKYWASPIVPHQFRHLYFALFVHTSTRDY